MRFYSVLYEKSDFSSISSTFLLVSTFLGLNLSLHIIIFHSHNKKCSGCLYCVLCYRTDFHSPYWKQAIWRGLSSNLTFSLVYVQALHKTTSYYKEKFASYATVTERTYMYLVKGRMNWLTCRYQYIYMPLCHIR